MIILSIFTDLGFHVFRPGFFNTGGQLIDVGPGMVRHQADPETLGCQRNSGVFNGIDKDTGVVKKCRCFSDVYLFRDFQGNYTRGRLADQTVWL